MVIFVAFQLAIRFTTPFAAVCVSVDKELAFNVVVRSAVIPQQVGIAGDRGSNTLERTHSLLPPFTSRSPPRKRLVFQDS